MAPRPLLSVPALAERLGTSERHVRRLVHERRIPFVKLGDGRGAPVRFDPADVDRWLDARRVEAS